MKKTNSIILAFKISKLAEHLECSPEEIQPSPYYQNVMEFGREEYLVLTDEEADEKTAEYIRETAWAFRAEFLASHMTGVDADDLKPIQEKCESANPIILKLIDDVDHFISDAIQADGRGHFLSGYDGEEIELHGELFAYRIN